VSCARYDSLRAGPSGDRIPVEARLSAPVETGHGANPASCTICTGSLPGVKWLGRGAHHPPQSSVEVEETVELYMKNKIQVDASYYFIMLMLCSTCFGQHYGRVSRPKAVTAFGPDTHPILPALNLQPAATRKPDGLCGNQRYCRDLLMMGIMVPETCWA